MYHECRHIMPSGKKCHSPALQNQVYCYYHKNLHRYNRPAASDNLTLFEVEDNRGIQIALTQVLTALNSPHLDTRRAGLMLYGLQIAAQLANRTSDLEPHEAVRTCDETTGIALAPEKTVCEPSRDCLKCANQHTCENYEDPEEEAEEYKEEEQLDDQDQNNEGDMEEASEEDLEDANEDEAEDQHNDNERSNQEVSADSEANLIRRAKSLLEESEPPAANLSGKPKGPHSAKTPPGAFKIQKNARE